MSLAIDYCKELAKELRQSAVYAPGINVSPGDIITFSERGLLGPQPLGPFKKVTSLVEMNIDLRTEQDKDPYSYVFASKRSVSVSFNAGGAAGSATNGKLAVKFSKEGATYLSAVDCKQTRFRDISNLEVSLEPYKTKVDWKHCFIVVAVTVAAKALIMQSNTSSASLEIEGEVKGLQPIPGATILSKEEINANIGLKVSGYNDASFIKPWSDNCAVFFQLVRYKKVFLGGWEVKSAHPELLMSESDQYRIELVDPLEMTAD
jgi:hypothetical protein